MPMEWSTNFETGEGHIDLEHQNLFDQVNKLEQLSSALARGLPIKKQEVDNLFDFLECYVNAHFAYEELCMSLRDCPAAATNREAHDRLLNLVSKSVDSYKLAPAPTQAMLEQLHHTLKHWLLGHVCGVDLYLRYSPQRDSSATRTTKRRRV